MPQNTKSISRLDSNKDRRQKQASEAPQQLSLFRPSDNTALSPLSDKKPQIKSIPGISIKEKNRYRIILGGKVLGDKLSLEEALAAAGMGGAK